MLNHAMKEERPGIFTATILTTDGATTEARFLETGHSDDPIGPTLILDFSGECVPRDTILPSFAGLMRVEGYEDLGVEVWGAPSDWGGYSFVFDGTSQHCLTTFSTAIYAQPLAAPATPPSRTG
jgi:hypothetical protein